MAAPAKTPAATSAPSTKPTNWEDVLNQLNSGGSANMIFVKAGRTRVRLVAKPGEEMFATVTSNFRGREKSKYMILAIDMSAEEDEKVVKGLVLPKTAFKSVVTLLSEGYELYDPAEGHGLTIIRAGSGLETSYNIMPSQKVMPVPQALIDAAPSLAELAKDYEENQARRAAQGGGDDGDEAQAAEKDW